MSAPHMSVLLADMHRTDPQRMADLTANDRLMDTSLHRVTQMQDTSRCAHCPLTNLGAYMHPIDQPLAWCPCEEDTWKDPKTRRILVGTLVVFIGLLVIGLALSLYYS